MVIFDDRNYQTSSEFPDTNFIHPDERQPKWIVSDDSELAERIKNAYDWQPVEDSEGNLIDIIEIPYTPSRDETNQQRAEEIKRQLEELDNKTNRLLRAILVGTSTNEDMKNLREIEAQAEILRAELAELEGGE